jgi:hypothetical protein
VAGARVEGRRARRGRVGWHGARLGQGLSCPSPDVHKWGGGARVEDRRALHRRVGQRMPGSRVVDSLFVLGMELVRWMERERKRAATRMGT